MLYIHPGKQGVDFKEPEAAGRYGLIPLGLPALINLLRLRREIVSPAYNIDACRDPSDNRILEAAVEGNADAIISGDADLLDIKVYASIPILRVAEFLAYF